MFRIPRTYRIHDLASGFTFVWLLAPIVRSRLRRVTFGLLRLAESFIRISDVFTYYFRYRHAVFSVKFVTDGRQDEEEELCSGDLGLQQPNV